MKYFLLIAIVIINFSCSGNKFVRKASSSANIEELQQFKAYLLEKNVMDNFREYKILTPMSDPVIKEFFRKYDIKLMYVEPCFKKEQQQANSHFKNCGHKISFSYSNVTFIEGNHSLIFDYSGDGLKLLDGIDVSKHKIAEGIFIF